MEATDVAELMSRMRSGELASSNPFNLRLQCAIVLLNQDVSQVVYIESIWGKPKLRRANWNFSISYYYFAEDS